jgi:hypothetical protein
MPHWPCHHTLSAAIPRYQESSLFQKEIVDDLQHQAPLLPGFAPDAPRRRNRRSACQSLRPPRPPLPPPLPHAFATGSGGGSGSRSPTNHQPAGATSIRPRDPNQHCRSTALPLRAVEYALPIRTSAAQPACQAPLNPGLSRCLLPLAPRRTPHRCRDHERTPRNQRPQNHERPRSASFGRRHDAVVAPASP